MKDNEPVTLYDHEDKDEDFYFEILSESNKLIIFSKEKIEVLDLADENKVVAMLSKEELDEKLNEVYPSAVYKDFNHVTF